MATANTNPTVAFARRRARHGKNPVHLRKAIFDFTSQNIAKSGTAEVLTIPGGTIVLGGYAKITSALTASATITAKIGALALSGALAKSAATHDLTIGGQAVALSACAVVNTKMVASADTLDLVAGAGAAIVAGKVELGIVCLDTNLQ